jgi:hypothetical protein
MPYDTMEGVLSSAKQLEGAVISPNTSAKLTPERASVFIVSSHHVNMWASSA